MRLIFFILLCATPILHLFLSADVQASTNSIITICKNADKCSHNTAIQQFVITESKGTEANVVLVNEVKNETVLYEVRIHDFGGGEFPGMIAVTAQSVEKASGVGHANALALARFMNDPFTETFQEGSVQLGTLSGYPTYALSHFFGLPHQLNLNGASMLSVNLSIQHTLNEIFANRGDALFEDLNGSVDGRIAINFRKVITAEVGASLDSNAPITSAVFLLKAQAQEGTAAWGVLVRVTKNTSRTLLTQIVGIALIDDGKVIFTIPISENGTVDLQSLIGSTIRIDPKSDSNSLRDWFRQVGFDILMDPCNVNANHCEVTIVDVKKK